MKKNEGVDDILMFNKTEVKELENRNVDSTLQYNDMKERNVVFEFHCSFYELGTETITEVKKEETDKDESDDLINLMNAMGTETITKANDEETDKDESLDFCNHITFLGTETKTAVQCEETDKDESDDELQQYKEVI